MAAEWSLHCQALHLSSREQKGGDGPEAKAPSSMAPPYYLYRVTLTDVYSQHLTVLGPLLTQESLGKTFYVGCTRGCHEQKQGFYVKWRRTDGQETENKPCLAQRPPRTRSTGFAYWNRLRFFPLQKLLFTIIFCNPHTTFWGSWSTFIPRCSKTFS